MRYIVPMMNVCYCGSMSGYPHAHDCPFPLFRGSRHRGHEWEAAKSGNAARDAFQRAEEYFERGLGVSAVHAQGDAKMHALNAWRHAQHVGLCVEAVDGGCEVRP